MSRSTRAFSLFEALCMIITLCVFGWLCVGVLRHEYKNKGKDEHADVIFTTTDGKDGAKVDATKPAPSKPEAPKIDTAPAGGPAPKAESQPAGSQGKP